MRLSLSRSWARVVFFGCALAATAGCEATTTTVDAAVEIGWSPAASMRTGRLLLTATLLPNGKVLVAGGAVGTAPLGSCELYDPSTNAWSPAAPMTTVTSQPTATLLPNGRVLVVGLDASLVLGAEVYDPATNAWTRTGPMIGARAFDESPSATLMSNGKVLVAGGAANGVGTLADAQIYDPSTNAWSSVAPMTEPRAAHTATLLSTGEILVAGGDDDAARSTANAFGTLASAERYDPTTDAWWPTGTMHDARRAATATQLPSGKVLVVGGIGAGPAGVNSQLASAELYDPTTDEWTTAGATSAPRLSHTATLLGNGRVLIVGGGDYFTTAATSELYDPDTNTWSTTAPMSASRVEHGATRLATGDALVIGGIGASGVGLTALTSADIFHPSP